MGSQSAHPVPGCTLQVHATAITPAQLRQQSPWACTTGEVPLLAARAQDARVLQPACPSLCLPHAHLCWATCRKGGHPRVLSATCPLAAVDLLVWPLLFNLHPNLLRPRLQLPPPLPSQLSVLACAHGPLPLGGGAPPADILSCPHRALGIAEG